MSTIEYKVLNGSDARVIDLEKLPFPDDAKVLYAFENNIIIGRLAIMKITHIEGAQVREDKRGSLVISRLFKEVENILRQEDKTSALSFIKEDDEKMIDYVQRVGYKELPYKVFLKPLDK